MTQKERIAALEAKLLAAEKAVENAELDRIDPALEAKAKKSASFAMKDVSLVVEALGLDLNDEQITIARETIYQAKLDYYLGNGEGSSLTAGF